MAPVITLLTDFGLRDHYVAAMKGMILSITPEATLVDISHDVPPQEVAEAAWLLSCCRNYFPEGTVHLAVVDPGVGGQRIPLALEAGRRFYVGPDNGIFTYVMREEKNLVAREITRHDLLSESPSATFHGRDIFAPAAAYLAAGRPFEELGPVVRQPRQFDLPAVEIAAGKVTGAVIHIDRFGNLISNISPAHLAAAGITPERMASTVADREVTMFVSYYAEAEDEEPFALIGSGGLLEIAVRNGSAAHRLGAGRGEQIVIRPTSRPA